MSWCLSFSFVPPFLILDDNALILYEGVIRVKKFKLNFGHEIGQKEGNLLYL